MLRVCIASVCTANSGVVYGRGLERGEESMPQWIRSMRRRCGTVHSLLDMQSHNLGRHAQIKGEGQGGSALRAVTGRKGADCWRLAVECVVVGDGGASGLD